MIAYTYKEHGKFELTDKPKPEIIDSRDAIVRVTLSSICTLLCTMLKNPKRIIVCEKDKNRIDFVKSHYSDVLVCEPENCCFLLCVGGIIIL